MMKTEEEVRKLLTSFQLGEPMSRGHYLGHATCRAMINAFQCVLGEPEGDNVLCMAAGFDADSAAGATYGEVSQFTRDTGLLDTPAPTTISQPPSDGSSKPEDRE